MFENGNYESGTINKTLIDSITKLSMNTPVILWVPIEILAHKKSNNKTKFRHSTEKKSTQFTKIQFSR